MPLIVVTMTQASWGWALEPKFRVGWVSYNLYLVTKIPCAFRAGTCWEVALKRRPGSAEAVVRSHGI